MNELIAQVAQRTGLSPEDAQKAVEAVINLLREKLPPPLASHLQAFIDGGTQGGLGALEAEAGAMLKGKLGGMLGGMMGGEKS
jgi:hypothetical protein